MISNDNSILVSIWCLTYNHEPYIRQCLEGIVMQKTNFRFEAIVHDDASTDGTATIVREYAEKFSEIIKPILEIENQYSKGIGNLNQLMIKQTKGKYVAICEGDDYWIDSNKLQMQVDFLESHSNVGLVWTDINRLHEYERRLEKGFFMNSNFPIKNTHEDFIMTPWFLAPCTWVFRSLFLNSLPNLDNNKYFLGDTLMLLHFSSLMEVHQIEKVTSVYRLLSMSASHFGCFKQKYHFYQKNKNTRLYFAREKSTLFRYKLWKKITFHERFSFKKHPSYILAWFLNSVKDFFVLLFKL